MWLSLGTTAMNTHWEYALGYQAEIDGGDNSDKLVGHLLENHLLVLVLKYAY